MRRANLKVILDLTSSQCNSRALAGSCVMWVKLCEQLRFTHVVISVMFVDTCVDKGSSYCLSHVICMCLPDVVECSDVKV